MNDVMWAQPDGRRVLLAPSEAVAAFVTAVYRFDHVDIGAVEVETTPDGLRVDAGCLRMTVTAGRWWPIPLTFLRTPAVTRYIEGPIARAVMGVHTYGITPSGVHEWYQADSYRSLVTGSASRDRHDLGPMGPLEPSLGVGVSEPPRRPSIVGVRPLLWDPSGRLDRVLR